MSNAYEELARFSLVSVKAASMDTSNDAARALEVSDHMRPVALLDVVILAQTKAPVRLMLGLAAPEKVGNVGNIRLRGVPWPR
jgi:hypothetical protein